MPVEVHCPNPSCAKVHQVKNKYAGMRGRCPACQSWMYIPNLGMMSSVPALELHPSPAALDETDAWSRAEPHQRPARKAVAQPPALEETSLGDQPTPALSPEEPAPRRKRPRPVEEVEPAEAGPDEADGTAKPKKHYSTFAVILLILANLGLVAFGVAPFVPGPQLTLTGDFANPNLMILGKPQGISADNTPTVVGAAGLVLFFGGLALLVSMFRRRIDFLSLFLLYIATFGSAALLFVSLESLKTEMGPNGNMAKLQRDIERRKNPTTPGAAVPSGDAIPSMGMQHYTLAGGAAAASFFFVIASLFMHRRLWSKLIGFMFLALWPGLAAAWVFRKELGIDMDLPFPLPPL